jgi:hypothetical protein
VEKMKKAIYLMVITSLLIVSIFVASGCAGTTCAIYAKCQPLPCCEEDANCKNADCANIFKKAPLFYTENKIFLGAGFNSGNIANMRNACEGPTAYGDKLGCESGMQCCHLNIYPEIS